MRREETIGERLRRLRLDRGLSQRELAAPGVSYAYISRIEASTRRPSVKALRMLAPKLGVTVEYLETGSDAREADERELRLADAELTLRLDVEPESARQSFGSVLADALAAGDERSTTRARLGLGLVAHQLGLYGEAVAHLEEAIAGGALSPALRPDVFGILGRSYAALGQLDRAIELFERCLQETAENEPANATAYARYASNLSSALVDADELDRAGEVLSDAIERTGDSADVYTRIRLYWSLARLTELAGRSLEALEHARRATALLEATDDTLHLARAYVLVAWILGSQGKAEDALANLEQAERLFGEAADSTDLAHLGVQRAQILARLGRGLEAVQRARAAIDLLGEHHPGEQGTAWWALAEGLVLEGEIEPAIEAFQNAIDLLDSNARWREAAEASRRCAKVLRDAGRDVEALDVLERATDLAARSQPRAGLEA